MRLNNSYWLTIQLCFAQVFLQVIWVGFFLYQKWSLVNIGPESDLAQVFEIGMLAQPVMKLAILYGVFCGLLLGYSWVRYLGFAVFLFILLHSFLYTFSGYNSNPRGFLGFLGIFGESGVLIYWYTLVHYFLYGVFALAVFLLLFSRRIKDTLQTRRSIRNSYSKFFKISALVVVIGWFGLVTYHDLVHLRFFEFLNSLQ